MKSLLKRRIAYGTNVTFGVALVFALAMMANWLARKYPRRYDFVQTSDLYKISDKTKNILKSLDQDVQFYVFSNPQDSELYAKVERLLKAYQAVSPRIKFTMVDSMRDIAKVRKLARELYIDEPDTVVIEIGDEKKVLTEMDMADFRFRHNDYTGGQIKELTQLKAEQAFTSAILELLNPTKIRAMFTVKHGEKSIFGFGDDGLSEAKRYLMRDNIIAEPLELVGLSAVTNCDILIAAGPTRKFLPHEINLIRRYLNNGGRGMFLLDPEIETGLIPLLEEYNVKVGNDIVVDPARQLPYASPLQLIIGLYGDHPITRKLQTFTIYPIARSVGVLDENNDVNVAKPLAFTSREGWGETDTDAEAFTFDRDKDNCGPVSISVDVDNKKTGMRMIVVGDSDFITNREILQGANRDIFMNAVNWLVKRELLVSIGPKTIVEMRRLNLSVLQLRIVTILVIVVVPLASVAAGVVVYIRRRH